MSADFASQESAGSAASRSREVAVQPDVPTRILSYVLREPGAHFREIQRALGMSTGQADHHLHRLVRDGLLARYPLAGEVHYFTPKLPRADRGSIAALRHPLRARLAEALLRKGTASLGELHEGLAAPESTLLHHLRVLGRAGVVWREVARRRVRYGLSDATRLASLLEGAPRLPDQALSGSGAWPPALGTSPRPNLR